MSKSFTPGPWKAELFEGTGWKGEYSKWDIFACDEPQTYVAGVNEDNDEVAANARLIAAAPELLEALIELRDYAAQEITRGGAHHDPVWANAANAIAKATGETQ